MLVCVSTNTFFSEFLNLTGGTNNDTLAPISTETLFSRLFPYTLARLVLRLNLIVVFSLSFVNGEFNLITTRSKKFQVNRQTQVMRFSSKTTIRIGVLIFLLLLIRLSTKFELPSSISTRLLLSKLTRSSTSSLPTIARVLYLFLCENQDEINAYANAFPSVTADVMFFCWKENCIDTNFRKLHALHAMQWTGRMKTYHLFIRSNRIVGYTVVKPRVFIINELQLNLTQKTTWTTARNLLYERALIEEQRQGWRWAYFNFADGDIQVNCPLADKLLGQNQIIGDELVLAHQYRALIEFHQSFYPNITTDRCFILVDTFLLTVSPAIGSFFGMGIEPLSGSFLAQIVYHMDAMFNAFHRDALPFILPYCPRYDNRTWWTSQAILVYRSLCLFGHAIQLNAVGVTRQKHRPYPRNADPWVIDTDMNLVPASLTPLQNYMKQSRMVGAVVLQHYGGWSLEMTSDDCRSEHTFVDPHTCKVSGKPDTTNS